MAAFGSLGGLGGMPKSKVVMTAEEAAKPWMDEFNKSKANNGYEQFANYFKGQLQSENPGMSPEQINQIVADKTVAAFQDAGGGYINPKVGASAWSSFADPAAVKAGAPEVFETDWGAFQKAQEVMGQYKQNELLGQQAYDSMSGWKQQNAVIGPDYSNPNFGQVSGQGATQITQVPGVDMAWAKGVYDPASFSTGLFGTNGQALKGWSF